MKPTITFILLLLGFQSLAATPVDTSRLHYNNALATLTAMLNGTQPPNYEHAIFVTENAYWDNQLDETMYTRVLDVHQQAIQAIINTRSKPVSAFTDAGFNTPHMLGLTAADKQAMYNKAVANYGIYRYLTDTTFFIGDSNLYYHLPAQYTHADPMGTAQWYNTQVSHLLDTRLGNCYATAALYKILADRLHSNAVLCTAPGHIYIRHADEQGIMYNIEPSGRSFPGTGSIQAITYTTDAAIKSGIAMRELDDKQAIALCLVYLAKSYGHKYPVKDDAYILQCAETALQYDAQNLNAMLLKAEVLEERLAKQNKPVEQLKTTTDFKAYEQLLAQLYTLGYREMPLQMKNTLVAIHKGDKQETTEQSGLVSTIKKTSNKETKRNNNNQTIGVSGGLFDEEIIDKPTEQYGRTLFDAKKKQIKGFTKETTLYDSYNFDPVMLAWNVDPMFAKEPYLSPYAFAGNSPILYTDKDGDLRFSALYYGEFKQKYPIIMEYIENQLMKDVLKSTKIVNAYQKIRGSDNKLTRKYLIYVFSNNSGPFLDITPDPGFPQPGARGHYDPSEDEIQIRTALVKDVEEVLTNNRNENDRLVAFMKFFMTITHEAGHKLNYPDDILKYGNDENYNRKMYQKSPAEVGYQFEQEIWGTDKYKPFDRDNKGLQDKNTKDNPEIIRGVIDNANKTEEGKASLPTVPRNYLR